MTVLIWIVLGLIIGVAASRFSRHVAGAFAIDIALGIIGAICGGIAYNALGLPPATGFALAGLLGAAVGAVALLVAYRTIFRRDGF